jgi:AbrB family looped-hinge helix DNA binding protein
MKQTVKITSKRQITIPIKLFRKLGLKKGDHLILRDSGGRINMKKSEDLINDLAGSITPPKKYRKLNIDKMIKKAKLEYFSKKK